MSLSVEQIIFPYKRLCKMRQVWPVQSWSSECSQRGRTYLPTHSYWNHARCLRYKALCLLITDRNGHTCILSSSSSSYVTLTTAENWLCNTARFIVPAAVLSIPLIFRRKRKSMSRIIFIFFVRRFVFLK